MLVSQKYQMINSNLGKGTDYEQFAATLSSTDLNAPKDAATAGSLERLTSWGLSSTRGNPSAQNSSVPHGFISDLLKRYVFQQTSGLNTAEVFG